MQYPLKTIQLTQDFGVNAAYYKQYGQKGHNGLDFGIALGTPVYASESGSVLFEGWGQGYYLMGTPAGICCLIDHGTLITGYAHLKDTVVNKGQKVVKGQLIGHSGSTGALTGPHLHFECILKPININNGFYGRAKPSGLTKCYTDSELRAQAVAEAQKKADEAAKAKLALEAAQKAKEEADRLAKEAQVRAEQHDSDHRFISVLKELWNVILAFMQGKGEQ